MASPDGQLHERTAPLSSAGDGRAADSPGADHSLVTFYQPATPAASSTPQCSVLAPGLDPVEARRATKRTHLSTQPPVPAVVPARADRPSASSSKRRKGRKHADRVPGPWVSALDEMPPLPLTASQRAKAGLSEVDAPHGDNLAIKHERAARALVSILPYGCATFILRDPDAVVASRPASETARRLVNAIKPHGVGSVNGAYSAYGRLLAWVVDHSPDSTAVHGSEFSDFCEATSPPQTVQDSFAWLRDHCGIDLPVRAPVSRPFRRPPPQSEAAKLSFSPLILMGLECLASGGETEFIRAHAAGWWFLAKARLRFEQSRDFVVNAVAPHEYRGTTFRMLSASVVREKHPDPSKRRPRPPLGRHRRHQLPGRSPHSPGFYDGASPGR